MPVLKAVIKSVRVNLFSLGSISPKTKADRLAKNKNRFRNASLTAEAALVFPIFFFAVYLLWQLFLLLLFQLEVVHTMTDTAMEYAHLGYPERKAQEKDVDISWLYQPILWNALPKSDRAEGMWVLCIPKEDGELEITVGYRFACEAVFFTKIPFPVQQSFRFYPYLGETDEDLFVTEDAKDIVYMTEHGTVYHESRACTYLNVVVRSVRETQVEEERNSSGRRYKLCERCDDRERTGNVYISAGGTKYHLAASCPSLKRTVLEKEREDVEGIPACHKCGKREEKEK